MTDHEANRQPDDSAGPWPIDRQAYGIRYRASFPSTTAGLNRAVRRVLGLARRCGCESGSRADVEIALREALANAMIHGNAYVGAKRIFLRCYASPSDGLLMIVRDEGTGFDPLSVPDPREADRMELCHGRGLLLMRGLMDYVEHRKRGREVVLFKRCDNGGP